MPEVLLGERKLGRELFQRFAAFWKKAWSSEGLRPYQVAKLIIHFPASILNELAFTHFSKALLSCTRCLISARRCRDALENPPCFQFAFRDRSSPSGVRGPVLFPPCSLHRPLDIGGDLQGIPFLVFAPHLPASCGMTSRSLFWIVSLRLGSKRTFLGFFIYCMGSIRLFVFTVNSFGFFVFS
jgi:hypothetical protein